MTEHEDLELGRCIQQRLGISCTRAYEANRLFKQNYDYNKQNDADRVKMFEEIATGSIATYHPNKEPAHQYQIHKAFKSARIGELIAETTKIEEELFKIKRELHLIEIDKRYLVTTCVLPP